MRFIDQLRGFLQGLVLLMVLGGQVNAVRAQCEDGFIVGEYLKSYRFALDDNLSDCQKIERILRGDWIEYYGYHCLANQLVKRTGIGSSRRGMEIGLVWVGDQRVKDFQRWCRALDCDLCRQYEAKAYRAREDELWIQIADSPQVELFQTYLSEFPDGQYRPAVIWGLRNLLSIQGGELSLPDMIFVEGGDFEQRTQKEGSAEVSVSDFWISESEVTQAQWAAIMGNRFTALEYEQACWDCPVSRPFWQVREFINRLNAVSPITYRLPTEQEWEFAARGRDMKYVDEQLPDSLLDMYAWHSSNSGGLFHPVMQKLPNEIGLYDMLGNAAEWVDDSAASVVKLHDPNSESDEESSFVDYPDQSIARGGNADSGPEECNFWYRASVLQIVDYSGAGFRLVCESR
ncbi:SUMF1/EgtB/PvdO family nonheme iron enzyme [Pontibacter sp. G13]|uniref:formylglycine-generating enzyme family protein n=1 Tax=Pontibacter sp. G13 TaxID=3074898 RepID=UPI00288A541A|nr:SUMF1/EgtB/PvdO family nonheme iron enzyme [Pontibacter sp. G13]WNJ19392.1 SUMF1/EgtB/PvdO family nonheme iron enzyme [Pontibacter sp. G13]